MPPTFLQAMHRVSAELDQALKSPEKATVALEGDQLPRSSWSLFSTWILGTGSGFLQLGRKGEQAEMKRSCLTNTMLDWGVKNEVTTSKHTKSALGFACCFSSCAV